MNLAVCGHYFTKLQESQAEQQLSIGKKALQIAETKSDDLDTYINSLTKKQVEELIDFSIAENEKKSNNQYLILLEDAIDRKMTRIIDEKTSAITKQRFSNGNTDGLLNGSTDNVIGAYLVIQARKYTKELNNMITFLTNLTTNDFDAFKEKHKQRKLKIIYDNLEKKITPSTLALTLLQEIDRALDKMEAKCLPSNAD